MNRQDIEELRAGIRAILTRLDSLESEVRVLSSRVIPIKPPSELPAEDSFTDIYKEWLKEQIERPKKDILPQIPVPDSPIKPNVWCNNG
jgi:hypothetical protein